MIRTIHFEWKGNFSTWWNACFGLKNTCARCVGWFRQRLYHCMGFSGEGQIWRFFKCARVLIYRFGDFFSTIARTVADGAALWQELFYNLLVFGLELFECLQCMCRNLYSDFCLFWIKNSDLPNFFVHNSNPNGA